MMKEERVYKLSSGNEKERQDFLRDLRQQQDMLKAKKKAVPFHMKSEDRQVMFYLCQIESCVAKIKRIIRKKRENKFFNSLSKREKSEIDLLVERTLDNMVSRR